MAYPERQLEKILKLYCKETGADYISGADGWINTIKKGDLKTFVIGYKFDLNNATSSQLCDDKAALSGILKMFNIPCVEHLFIESPNGYNRTEAEIKELFNQMLKTYDELVLKPNIGSGGRNVFRCKTVEECYELVEKLLSPRRSLCVCEFEKIKEEYRAIFLDGKIKLVYKKLRPSVVGDGFSNLESLISQQIDKSIETDATLNLKIVPLKNERVFVSWKHNLGLGAVADVNIEKQKVEQLELLAQKVAKAINITFASIDIIETESNELKVLEVNSGVMMEKFSKMNDENFEKAKQIYFEALNKTLNIKK